jgi:TRAP-type C4-dicarboxylate transport system substrate-binding protein
MMKHLLLTLGVCTVLATQVQAKELRSSGAAPEPSPWGQVTNAFTAKVAELSGGALTVNHFHGSQLGDEQTTVKQVARGRLDIGLFSNTATSLLVPEFGLLASPYTFTGVEQADCVADNHLLPTFGDAMDAAGVVPIAWLEIGQQIIFSKDKLVKTPADLDGVKIRTAPTKTDTLYMQTAGGSAVPLGTTDTMPALKTGNVDAATWPTVYGIAVGYHEVAPNVTVTNHVHQIGSVIVSKRVWSGLSEEEQGWLREAAEVFKGLRTAVRNAEGGLLGKIAGAEGVTVHNPSDAEMDAWRAVAPDAQKTILAELGGASDATWAAIADAKEKCQ